MNHNMTDGSNESCKCHDKRACANSRLQLHLQKRSKYYQHYHAAASTHKTRSETNRQTEEQGNRYAFSVQFLTLTCCVLTACIGLNQKADAYEECQKKRKTAQHHITHNKSHITPYGAHGQNACHHDPSAF